MNEESLLIAGILANDRNIVPYRKELTKVTGSVTSSILLSQMLYWAQKNSWEPFYKFIAPCKHKAYKDGDSWTEELGFSKKEFSSSLSRIATKIGTNKSGETTSRETVETTDSPQSMIVYWTNASRITYYEVNINAIAKLLKGVYLNAEREFSVNAEREFTYTETTTETTTDSRPNGHALSDENLSHTNGLVESIPSKKENSLCEKAQLQELKTAWNECIQRYEPGRSIHWARTMKRLKQYAKEGMTADELTEIFTWLKQKPFWKETPMSVEAIGNNRGVWTQQKDKPASSQQIPGFVSVKSINA